MAYDVGLPHGGDEPMDLALFLRRIVAAAMVPLALGCTRAADDSMNTSKPSSLKYPETRRVDQTDEYHGVKVADPYRWLEDDVRESPEVAEWVKKQNEVARAYLD